MTRERSLRLAHMTDVHVQPERGAGEGLSMALDHMQSLDVAPDLQLTTATALRRPLPYNHRLGADSYPMRQNASHRGQNYNSAPAY